MSWFDFLKGADHGDPKVSIPLTPEEVRHAARTFQFRRTFVCSQCKCELTIRAREDRSSGPSNYRVYPETHRSAGHSVVPSGALTWRGLAEERGWKLDPIVCPACQEGVSVDEYKRLKREGRI